MMVKEGGWTALVAVGLGSLGFLAGLIALALLPLSRKAGHIVGMLTLVIAFLAAAIGASGVALGRRQTDRVLSMPDIGRGTKSRVKAEGYREAQSSGRVGFGAALLPFLLGAAAALFGARKTEEEASSGVRWGFAIAGSGLVFLTAGGALAASRAKLPAPMQQSDAYLLDARDRVDADIDGGCTDLEEQLYQNYWHPKDRTFDPDPHAIVPDLDSVSTRCLRERFSRIKAGTSWTRPQWSPPFMDPYRMLQLSPLLVDEALRKEINDALEPLPSAAPTPSTSVHDTADPPILPAVNGRLPPEVVQRIVRYNMAGFRRCYEKGLQKNPQLEGKVTVRFVIGSDGSVTSASDGGSTMPDRDVIQCCVSRAKTLSFPAPEGGIVTVTYPFVFKID